VKRSLFFGHTLFFRALSWLSSSASRHCIDCTTFLTISESQAKDPPDERSVPHMWPLSELIEVRASNHVNIKIY